MWQRQLKGETRNISVLRFGASYIIGLTVHLVWKVNHSFCCVVFPPGEQLWIRWPLRTALWLLRGKNCWSILCYIMIHYATNILHDFFTGTRTMWWISPGNLITPRGQSYDWPTTTLRWRHNECDSVSNHQPHDCLLSRLSGRRSKLTSKLRVTGLCVGNSPGTGEFSAQMASNAEKVSIWWRHHEWSNLEGYGWSDPISQPRTIL